jgi:hypothetical protein
MSSIISNFFLSCEKIVKNIHNNIFYKLQSIGCNIIIKLIDAADFSVDTEVDQLAVLYCYDYSIFLSQEVSERGSFYGNTQRKIFAICSEASGNS